MHDPRLNTLNKNLSVFNTKIPNVCHVRYDNISRNNSFLPSLMGAVSKKVAWPRQRSTLFVFVSLCICICVFVYSCICVYVIPFCPPWWGAASKKVGWPQQPSPLFVWRIFATALLHFRHLICICVKYKYVFVFVTCICICYFSLRNTALHCFRPLISRF